ncbi:hypothetical protein GW17_00051446 [Ensete ventricosum]|uniref:Uncharacterized protein n=1 Tax=Ensete ventricosum TaxID=4639 RepID=A0A426ZKR4_ENSVE|nr:hypothetical protein B296_00028146 [Ensete ventricosum]RWV86635.1 hypothetical protein GW17_00051446 [Ensete ventricosum]
MGATSSCSPQEASILSTRQRSHAVYVSPAVYLRSCQVKEKKKKKKKKNEGLWRQEHLAFIMSPKQALLSSPQHHQAIES